MFDLDDLGGERSYFSLDPDSDGPAAFLEKLDCLSDSALISCRKTGHRDSAAS